MTRSRSVPPPTPQPARLSVNQIRAAIPQLERRIAELEALPVEAMNSGEDPRIIALVAAIDGTLARVYGPDSHEYQRLWQAKILDDTDYNFYSETSEIAVRAGIERGRQRATALLNQESALLQEQLGDEGGQPD